MQFGPNWRTFRSERWLRGTGKTRCLFLTTLDFLPHLLPSTFIQSSVFSVAESSFTLSAASLPDIPWLLDSVTHEEYLTLLVFQPEASSRSTESARLHLLQIELDISHLGLSSLFVTQSCRRKSCVVQTHPRPIVGRNETTVALPTTETTGRSSEDDCISHVVHP